MKILRADFDRRIAIEGVPDPVQRPVDIDSSKTGFKSLRSLRIYRFAQGVTIDGHAEEDEVFIVVMTGSVELTVTGDKSGDDFRSFTLSGADISADGVFSCVYMPPEAAYRLVPKTEAEVAYARSTPADGPPSRAFALLGAGKAGGVTVMLEATTYAQRLRLRLMHVNADKSDIDCMPIDESEAKYEALVHLRMQPAAGAVLFKGETDSTRVESWDTAALNPGDRMTLHFAAGCLATILAVSACD